VKQRKGQVIHGISPSPPRKSRELKPIRESREASMEDEERSPFRDEHQKMKSSDLRSVKPSVSRAQKDSLEYTDKYSPGSLISLRSVDTHRDYVDSRKKDQDTKSEKLSLPEPATTMKVTLSSEKVKEPYLGEDNKGKLGNEVDQKDRSSDENDKHRSGNNEKRKSRKSKRHEVTSDDDYSDNSQKDAKKQRKEEKRLKKEERRQRREQHRRKKNERRSEKTKLKTAGYSSDEEESEQKRLEIELREKALERLRAKKGSGK
jgi:serine/arginine repetitive matrix protein 1